MKNDNQVSALTRIKCPICFRLSLTLAGVFVAEQREAKAIGHLIGLQNRNFDSISRHANTILRLVYS